MELLRSSGISGVRTRIAVLSIWTASSKILFTCLSIISSAALAGSSERMNRFIFRGLYDVDDVECFTILFFVMLNYRIKFISIFYLGLVFMSIKLK